MIITCFQGGLGNQLFQYAAARCLAYRLNTEFKIDVNGFEGTTNSHHEFYKLNNFNVKENFATKAEVKILQHMHEMPFNNTDGAFNPEIFNSPDNTYLTGNFQSEQYFVDIADVIRSEFTLKNPLEKNSAAWREKILSASCAVSLHVRHGDYLTYGSRNFRGLLPVNYYQTCLNELRKDYPDITVFVFSDDLDWCKGYLKFNAPTEFVEGCEHDFEELYLMSICKHNIISNGTFAWWSAWLNKNPDKKVLAPELWFALNPNMAIVPESWIKIPAAYNLWMPPMLSVIVYSEMPPSDSSITLKSILAQTLKDYEIIFINPSQDGEEKVYRHKVNSVKFSVVTVNNFLNKFESLNKGLSVARGDYVLFLTDKEFILPHTLKMLSDLCNSSIFMYADNRRTHLTYANFTDYLPNIIDTTQMLKEDDGGNSVIDKLPDKKFFIQTDAAFKDVNGIAELNIAADQKLMLLATGGVNNSVATKFFKRKFLAENKIAFKGNGGGTDAELLFLVNAFLATEKILFVPSVCSGRLK